MNKRMIVYMLGRLVSFEGILLLFPTLVAVIYKENTFLTYLCCALALILLGLLMSLIKIKDKTIFSKEGLVTVCMFLLLEYKLYLTPLPFGF